MAVARVVAVVLGERAALRAREAAHPAAPRKHGVMRVVDSNASVGRAAEASLNPAWAAGGVAASHGMEAEARPRKRSSNTDAHDVTAMQSAPVSAEQNLCYITRLPASTGRLHHVSRGPVGIT